MLILGAVGLQIRLSDCSTFNVQCFCRKDTTNETLQSDFPFFSFDSFDSFFSFFSPLIVHRLFVWLVVCCYRSSLDMILTTIYLQCKRYIIKAITHIIYINKWIIPKPDSTVGLR